MANMEYNNSQVNTMNLSIFGLDPKSYVPGTGSGYIRIPGNVNYTPTATMSKLKLNMIAYFGLVDYDFDNRFGIVATVRRDGTSRFGDGTTDPAVTKSYQWGTFWSIAGRWNIDSESFMKNQELFQTLKFRASIGTNGNQRIQSGTEFVGLNPPGFMNTFRTVTNVYNNLSGIAVTLAPSDLRWETTKQINLGLDFEMVKRRLRGSVDVYNKNTTDLFYLIPVSIILESIN